MDLLHYHLLTAYDVEAAGQTLGRGGALAHELSVEVVDVGVVLLLSLDAVDGGHVAVHLVDHALDLILDAL